jgi:ABC-2 type transport system ATP-binding protein/capsular polysaccharide transport system ATP-binding protein
MIRLDTVGKDYPVRGGMRPILRAISFDLYRGEKLGIFGRNGSGKSTLIRLISGAEMPTSGTIERSMSVSWPLAFIGAFQGSLTGRDNVRFISRIYDSDFVRNISAVEHFAELGPYLDEPVKTYSSGMQARLAFALSMIIEFDCFLIDEVGAVGDLRFRQKCEDELFEKRKDRAMILVSHEVNYIKDHCNRFAVLDQGRLEFYDSFDHAYGTFCTIMTSAPA